MAETDPRARRGPTLGLLAMVDVIVDTTQEGSEDVQIDQIYTGTKLMEKKNELDLKRLIFCLKGPEDTQWDIYCAGTSRRAALNFFSNDTRDHVKAQKMCKSMRIAQGPSTRTHKRCSTRDQQDSGCFFMKKCCQVR